MQSSTNLTPVKLDGAATTFSLACIAHCIALPIVAAALPFFAVLAEAEWVHWLLTALAIVASFSVIATDRSARGAQFLVPALLGITFIAGALFAERFGVDETLPTVIGGIVLAAAHIFRIFKHTQIKRNISYD
jgi:hypothetical protein